MSGQVSYLSGVSAEDQVARRYARTGHVILARRWRGRAGELDLVAVNELGEACYASPAISGKRIYLRGEHNLYCIGESSGD